MFALGKDLEGRGAHVEVLKLPVGEAGAKVGLADYLCAHPVTTLDELPRLALKHPLFKRAAAWWRECLQCPTGLAHELIVVGVGANPEPHQPISCFCGERAMVGADPC